MEKERDAQRLKTCDALRRILKQMGDSPGAMLPDEDRTRVSDFLQALGLQTFHPTQMKGSDSDFTKTVMYMLLHFGNPEKDESRVAPRKKFDAR